MSNEELKALAKKIKEGMASDAEKVAFVKELNASLKSVAETLNKAQKAEQQ